MLDGVTLDQLRTFIAAVDEGSFSAAGRKLRRAQSVVSQTAHVGGLSHRCPAGRWFINCLKQHSDSRSAQHAVRLRSASGKRR